MSERLNVLTAVRQFSLWADRYQSLTGVESQHYKRLADLSRRTSRYAGFHSAESYLHRYIIEGEVLVVLPPHPQDEEVAFGKWVAQESAPVVEAYRQRFDMPEQELLPVIFYRTNEEVAEVAKRREWAGPVSLSYAPLWTTLNLQAVRYCIDKLGQELGTWAIRYSFRHEHGHPILERERIRLALEAGYSLEQYAETTRVLQQKNQFAFENAANNIHPQDGLNIYPNAVASLESRHGLVTPANIISYSYDDSRPPDELLEKLDGILYPMQEGISLSDGTRIEIPFVSSPQCAHANIIEKRVAELCRERMNSDFSWTAYILNHLKHDPLVRETLGMPNGFREVMEELKKEFT